MDYIANWDVRHTALGTRIWGLLYRIGLRLRRTDTALEYKDYYIVLCGSRRNLESGSVCADVEEMVAEVVGCWMECSRADGTRRERGCPGPGGPRPFSSTREESGLFYWHRHRFCDTVPITPIWRSAYYALFRLSLGRSVNRVHSPRLLDKRGTSCDKL